MAESKILTPAEFYKKLGKEDRQAVRDLSEKKKIEFVPTGSWVINNLIGDGTGTYKPGGLPRGHIVEVFGTESCGKTTLGISACIQAQNMGGLPVWLDYERTFHREYATRLGLDCSPDKLVFLEPDHFEHGSRLILQTFSMKPVLIVVDSVSAMIPKQFLEGSIDDVQRIGLQAQLMSIFLNFISKHLSNTKTCLLFCNQLRSQIKGQFDPGPKEETSGGRALKYYSSVRISMQKSVIERVSTRSRITGKTDKEPINVKVNVKIAKNKIDKPYLTGPLYIRFGDGFDNISSIVELGLNTNVIKKKGSYLNFDQNGTVIFNVQGKEQLRHLLENDEKKLKILTDSLVFEEDEEIKKVGDLEEYEPDSDKTGSKGVEDLENMLDQASENFTKGKKKNTNGKSKN